MGEKYEILVVKSEGKRQLERHRCRWENNINMDPKDTECEGVGWILVSQDS
jgi:hypothetical protein